VTRKGRAQKEEEGGKKTGPPVTREACDINATRCRKIEAGGYGGADFRPDGQKSHSATLDQRKTSSTLRKKKGELGWGYEAKVEATLEGQSLSRTYPSTAKLSTRQQGRETGEEKQPDNRGGGSMRTGKQSRCKKKDPTAAPSAARNAQRCSSRSCAAVGGGGGIDNKQQERKREKKDLPGQTRRKRRGRP